MLGAEPVGTVLVGVETVGLVAVPSLPVAAPEPDALLASVLEGPVLAVPGPYVLAAPSTDVGARAASSAEVAAELVAEPDRDGATA